jgi:hypothetical protein
VNRPQAEIVPGCDDWSFVPINVLTRLANLSSREQPAGVFRRTYTEDGGRSDEAFTRKLIWEYSTSLISAERGDLQNDFIEITEDEANQIVARIRAR